MDAGELKEIDLVRKNWATNIARKLSRKKKNKQPAKGVSQYHEHDMSSLDFSLGSKKAKSLANLFKVILVCIVIGIAYWGYDSYLNDWKKDAEYTKSNLKQWFSNMPDYKQYQDYLDKTIDRLHEKIIDQCRHDKKVRGQRYSKNSIGRSYTYYQTFFNHSKYLRLMDKEIRRQAQIDQRTAIVDWLDLQKKKEERKEERERNWYMDELR